MLKAIDNLGSLVNNYPVLTDLIGVLDSKLSGRGLTTTNLLKAPGFLDDEKVPRGFSLLNVQIWERRDSRLFVITWVFAPQGGWNESGEYTPEDIEKERQFALLACSDRLQVFEGAYVDVDRLTVALKDGWPDLSESSGYYRGGDIVDFALGELPFKQLCCYT